jgi:hypothetical protein
MESAGMKEYQMDTVKLGGLEVSRFILGGNPFSGFSHQNAALDHEMVHYFTSEQIKALFRQAESLGVTTHIGRADHHIMRVLTEYWDEGGTIQWLAQTCPEVGSTERGVQNGLRGGAKAIYLHGGDMDHRLATGTLDDIPAIINMIHDHGLPAGIAGHLPATFEWAEEHLNCDFYMCCYYNPIFRAVNPENPGGLEEVFDSADRDRMVALIPTLTKPVIHYKILASGRTEPREAFRFTAEHLRPEDAVCVGIFNKHRPNELEEDVRMFEEAMRDVGK